MDETMFGNMFFMMGELMLFLLVFGLLYAYNLVPIQGADHKRPKDQPREFVSVSHSGGRHRAPRTHHGV